MNAITVISRQLHGSPVEQRQRDGYINATALSSAYKLATGKRRDVAHWLELERTKETLNHLSSITGIPVIELYQSFRGSPENGGGTWIHPKLAVRFGIWLSDEFGYQVEQWVEEWVLKGQSTVLDSKVLELESKLETAMQAIAQLQAQVQNLLPPSSDFIPPGWKPEVWQSLPPQDKRHFRFLYRHRRFRPSQQGQAEPVALPAISTEQMKEQQRSEVAQLVGEVSPEEKQQLQAAKLQALREFWSQAPEEDQKNMPF
ncbi:KilA-N domain-containing protein [Anabaena azotica]|uniref:KilA-N domain-containing protein n=1 Tax=Anabaena azotica FACHB-119 TaxID=947527 RepID=A0ABR8DD25_9NOST|nr:KilA-N domain-containing protein [Anabaena azotica]MBD2504871.1 KilA-N domain-containing protein [Anabaena azotica FACHB-119]